MYSRIVPNRAVLELPRPAETQLGRPTQAKHHPSVELMKIPLSRLDQVRLRCDDDDDDDDSLGRGLCERGAMGESSCPRRL